MTVHDVDRQNATVMNIPSSSTGQIHLLRLQIQLLGCCGSAVQGLHIYDSVVDGAGCSSSEQTEYTEAVEGWLSGTRDHLEGPRPQLQLGSLHFQLRLDFECWMSHCSVISAHDNTFL